MENLIKGNDIKLKLGNKIKKNKSLKLYKI
jgi:hypothetical protein